MSQVTIIKGEGIYPTPEVRKVYPNRRLLWKYYLTVFLIWIAVSVGLLLLMWFILFVADDPPPENMVNFFGAIFWGASVVIIVPTVLLLPFYVNAMEFVVHGDEVVVKKGLINKTVKYCPYRSVTNISTTAGPLDRFFGIGCVNVQTAGKGGTSTGPEEKLEGLPLYHEIRDYILNQLRIYYVSVSGKIIINDKTKDSESLQREIINELREIKRLLYEKEI